MNKLVLSLSESQKQVNKRCLHHLFEAQVEQLPDAVAAVFEELHLTYAHLNQRANQLACYLRKQGVGPDVLVGLCLPRSLDMLIALLAILKAGGAYLPLDPLYPRERLAFMLTNSAAPVVITQSFLQENLPDSSKHVKLCIDREWEQISQESSQAPISGVTSAHLAYMIYTSGSTGTPKGILIEHHSVVNLAIGLDQAVYAHLPATSLHITLNGSLAFDTSVKQLIQLLAGHTLYIVPDIIRFDGEALLSYICRHALNVLDCTPSQLRLLLQNGRIATLDTTLICVLVGGEAIDEVMWQTLTKDTACGFYNMYGPTECTVDATISCVQSSPTTPTIGHPISNVEVYVLDPDFQPVLVGTPGELYISGLGLARGYLNHFELTAQAFLPNPFSKESGARMYKSGDLGRVLPDGTIEFLGRVDQQVKVRGFRIELGEIESVLAHHPAVRESAVIAYAQTSGDARLIGYIVAQQSPAPTGNELRRFLRETLPEYMLPAAFVVLAELPLTPNGKLDRRALPMPDVDRPDLDMPFVAPKTSTEERVAEIWSSVLGLRQVGIYDNFFELGGHSLLVTQVISRVRQAFRVELPLQSLFEDPTVAHLVHLIQGAKQGDQHAQFSGIQPVARDRHLPLTFAQERVLFIQQLYPKNKAYYFRTVLRFTGQLQARVLEKTFTEIVRRHEIFRTTFHEENGYAVQVIHAPWRVFIPIYDLQVLSEDEREAAGQQIINGEFQKSFDLAQLPLVRWVLLRSSNQEHALIQVEHHLIHDGWSFNVFLRELRELYESFSQGKGSSLPELPIQFADFAYWQRQWIKSAEAATQLAYWKKKLEGSSPMLELPTDRPRPAVQHFRGAIHRIEISHTLARSLRALSRQEGVTLFMTMLAAFQTLLFRYTGQADIVVGSGIANRRWRETEELIGMMINTIALRTNFSGFPTFRELLQHVRQVTLEAYTHQDLPFEEIVKALQLERDLSRNPLIQVLFGFHDAPLPDLELPDLTIDVLDLLDNGSAKFDLTIIAIPRAEQRVGASSGIKNEGITLIWEYNTDLFDASTSMRMAQHFQILLEGIAANPEQRNSELPVLTRAEQSQMLFEWNHSQMEYPKERCLHHLFEAQVEQLPDAVAAVFEEQHLTYAQLNQRANQLACYLSKQGVGPDVLVGLCLPRSLDMLIALLAILKAGGAYVPLDPLYPRERLAFILTNSAAPVVITQSFLQENLPDSSKHVKLCIDREWEQISQESSQAPISGVTSAHLAYMIYTSGSTGTPKGVQISHSAVVNFHNSMRIQPGLAADDILFAVTTLSFDIAGLELFLPLSVGARVVIGSHQVAADGAALVESLRVLGITVMQATPATWRLLVEARWHPEKQFTILCGGEALAYDLATQLLTKQVKLWNLYGPTETTIWSSISQLEAGDGEVLLGSPIANTQIYLLDTALQPVPIGVVGEIYIGGAGVARGYFDQAELTAHSFIPHPFSETPGTRLYKTGDVARYRTNGKIEFLGRIDHQVKIRGHRIELGEISAILEQYPAIEEAVVLVHGKTLESKELVAYIKFWKGLEISSSELSGFLREKLPSYMIPSVYMALPTFPLTPNGKIDRRALSKLSITREVHDRTAPSTSVEAALLQIWEQLLTVEQIGIHDNFFQLGGHSLIITLLQFRLKDRFQVDVPLQDLFANATIAQQAKIVEQMLVAEQWHFAQDENLPFIQRPGPDDDKKTFVAPMSSAQRRQWFLDQLDSGNPAYDIFRWLQLEGKLDIEALHNSLQAIVDRHEIMRTSLVNKHGQLLQEIASLQPVQFDVIDLSGLAELERESKLQMIIQHNATYPFHLTERPLWYITLVRLHKHTHLFLLTFHHAITDGWSLNIFMHELQIFYAHFTVDTPVSLPPLKIQYADYTQLQHKKSQEEQVHYWKHQLAQLTPLILPYDHPRPILPTFQGKRLPIALSVEDSQGLKLLSQQLGVTLFMTLLTIFQTLLHCYSQQNDIAIGTDVANRTSRETEHIMGLFVNQLIIRTRFQGNPTFLELLQAVRETMLEAYAHQDLPFEKLVDMLQPERELNSNPLFQVKFVLQQPLMRQFNIADVEATILPYDNHTAKLDLLLNLEETDQGLRGIAQYSTDLFELSTIEQLIEHFSRFLQGIIRQPHISLEALRAIFAEAERHNALQRTQMQHQSRTMMLRRAQRKIVTSLPLLEE